MTPAEFKRLALPSGRPRKRRAQPEAILQAQIVRWLSSAIKTPWSASSAGVRLSAGVAAKMKSQGIRPGWPDLMFLDPATGFTRYIELKSDVGTLSAEQREFAKACAAHDLFRCCRSLEEVQAALKGWGLV